MSRIIVFLWMSWAAALNAQAGEPPSGKSPIQSLLGQDVAVSVCLGIEFSKVTDSETRLLIGDQITLDYFLTDKEVSLFFTLHPSNRGFKTSGLVTSAKFLDLVLGAGYRFALSPGGTSVGVRAGTFAALPISSFAGDLPLSFSDSPSTHFGFYADLNLLFPVSPSLGLGLIAWTYLGFTNLINNVASKPTSFGFAGQIVF